MRKILKKEDPDQDPIDYQIESVLSAMDVEGPTSKEYHKLMKMLERLNKLKEQKQPERVSRDTIAIVAGNLFGILLIVAYEQKHVLTSKGFGQIIRPVIRAATPH